MGIAQRTILAFFDHSKEKYSPRKLIPVNVKTLGDHLLLKRIEVDLTQQEVAHKAGVSTRMVRKWECGKACPTEDHWQALARILHLDYEFGTNQNPTLE